MKPRQVIGSDLPGFLLLCNVRFEIALYGQEIYINRQSKIGRKMAGTRFMILIFDATSMGIAALKMFLVTVPFSKSIRFILFHNFLFNSYFYNTLVLSVQIVPFLMEIW